MKSEKFNVILNCIMLLILVALAVSVYVIHGLAGAVAWAVAKLFIAPVGVVLVLVNLILLVKGLVRKRRVTQKVISLFLSILIAFPMLMLMNIIQIEYPANVEKSVPSITVRWPLKESAIVAWGGGSVKDNAPHAIWASEKWAYDLVMEPFDIDSRNNSDFGIYDKEVVAPASGIITAAFDGEEDIVPNTEEFLSLEGNYVYIKLDATGTYLLMNHLKKGSVTVKTGDHVNEGDVIGRVGNSGTTSEPHLHIHHQRQEPAKTLHLSFAEGLPLFFRGIDGKDMPVKGAVITPKN